MRIAFLVFNLDGPGGTPRSAITQATALCGDHDVRLISIVRTASTPHFAIDARVETEYLVDVRDEAAPALAPGLATDGRPDRAESLALHGRESAIVPSRWDRQFTALCDVALEAALPRVEADVVVTVTPGLLACAVQLLTRGVAVVHQEHRSSSDRTDGMEPLLAFAPRTDVVALLTSTTERWLVDRLGDLAPPTVVLPNPLPGDFTPRSLGDTPLIVSAGRLVPEKQFTKLVRAFALVADRIPEWRLRICGDGPRRGELLREIRRADLWDRVELPGAVTDMSSHWAQASVAALTSRSEGFGLVLQEAMAAGVPPVSFDAPSGPREIIEHEVNGLLVAPQSVTGMASALLRLTTDHDLRARLGAAALRSSQQYDARLIAARWESVFAGALERRASRSPLAARAPTPSAPVVATASGPAAAGTTPAEARHDALTHAVAAARAACSDWWVIPPHETAAPVVVLPITGRDAFLAALADADLPAYLSLRDPDLHSWPLRRGPVAAMATDLRRGMTSSLALEPWPERDGEATLLGQGCSVEVEFWDVAPDGDLVAPSRNAYLDRAPAGAAHAVTTVEDVEVPTLPLMVGPGAFECAFPIDVVYTWVDGADPAWNAAREARLGDSDAAAGQRSASGAARFTDRDELRHSLRSLHLFAPWVRRIHVVTAGQVPDWLDASHPSINLVDHAEILPAAALPTFNSHAIETALHRIEGLSEQFLYLNDDFFLGRPLRPETFFSPSGRSACFLSPRLVGQGDDPATPAYLLAARNNRRLLQEAVGVTLTRQLAHTPYPLRVSTLAEMTDRFAADLARTAHTPFRSGTDVAPLSSLAQHYGLATGAAYVGECEHTFVDLAAADVERRLRALLRRDKDFFCLGDQHDHAVPAERLEAALHDFYATYFPIAAPWERG